MNDHAALVAAAVRLRRAVERPVGPDVELDPVQRTQLFRSLEAHVPALFEAIGDVLVAATPPPTLEEARRLHPSAYPTTLLEQSEPIPYTLAEERHLAR